MKFLFVVLCASVSLQAFSAETLKCKSSNGSTLEWKKSYGELVASGPRGEFIADQDALAVGRSRRSGNNVVTDIVYGDESEYEVFATIVKTPRGTSVVLDGMTFNCK